MNSLIESMKKWLIERPDEKLVDHFTEELNISTVHAKILISRGITNINEAKDFLNTDETALHDPFLFHQMDHAVNLIKNAIHQNKKIAIYGDYDCDGVTSITVLMTALERLGADVFFVIPNRFEHGYGPHKDLFQEIYEAGASMIITVDNGVSGIDEIAFAKTLGMEVIITDHHEAGKVWPAADATLHPRHPEGQYPIPDLAGVGVAFKLACALLGEVPKDLLEIVAIGTVADLVSLRGENRYFVKKGIELMRKSRRPGIQALAKVAGTAQDQLTEESIGFMIGPRLNAPGRLGDAASAVELLKTEDGFIATGLAEELDDYNKERQGIVSTITKEAEAMVQKMYGNEIPAVFVLAKEGWNPGVVGIVASRLTDKYYRPAIVLSLDDNTGMAKGSARSIEGFNMYEELSKNADLLTHFGGHPVAAGLSLEMDHVALLRERLIEQAEATMTQEQFIPKLAIDLPLSLDEIDVNTLQSLDLLRPFGMDFEKPTYLIENISAASIRKIGAARNHLKVELTDGTEKLDAIGFGLGELADHISPGIQFSIVGDLQINEWNGNKKPQLLVEDIHSNEWQLFDLRGIREVSRWIHTVPTTKSTFFAFQERTIKQLRSAMNGHTIQLYGEHHLPTKESLILLDLPNDSTQLKEVVKESEPSRIYAHFYVPESTYFDAIPGREQFGWYYSFLKSRGSFDLKTNGEKLAQHKGWKNDIVFFMSEVFSDLGFVKIEDGVITMMETNEKRDLTEAPTYKARKRKMELEKKLLYAPYNELKRWFDDIRCGTIDREEQ
ncbi:single-stranded-DNA-specific exonuclease RecJ [Sporosarcina pasteurii]|uniref:single-stranded-DNA-specific exonuclease RecJ n=1 Tax=Sporosarcina pasteurii TaxID=1474 RepID=UPI00287C43CF|nr:single-stranded-DNA-specific exonuclease RecJ [Sporosarcina pasteurii]MDS9471297.1 single-stranded-DNA-specific exonuclease RecJ [Sporosarcina pasteurii]